MGLIKTYFMPNDYVQSVFQIDIEKLANSGFKGIITDLDNTLVGWDVKTPTKEIQEWFKKANDLGFSKDLDVDFIFKARKPMGRAFKKAIQHMNIKPEETIVIGDQMLTDVLGGNNNGLYTIMVVPVKKTDGFLTRLNRIIERRLLNYFKRKGYITWEEN